MLRLSSLFALLLLCFSVTYAQPKREFRAVWVANVTNVDWPSAKNLSPDQQRAELIALLDLHQKQGINAIFFQVRNACDAVYQSSIEPWSEWLMGTQGQSPGYDPLALLVQECRKRNMEVHAWLNPYRAVVNTASSSVAANHVSRTNPDWIQTYGTLKLLDPGLPEVRSYVTRVVMDVVSRYDVDGIHFDDYFYPYPQAGVSFNDDATYAKNSRGIANRADWRRDNVNLMVKNVSDSIKATKPWVKFGISPSGIWQNRSSSTLGSATTGFESYVSIYADSRLWAQRGWLDYIVPQVYWSIGFSAANFSVLLPWWVANSGSTHLYMGHGAYQLANTANTDANWKDPKQIPNQIRLVRSTMGALGSAFFSAKTLKANPLGVGDSLTVGLFNKPALIPVMANKDIIAPATPTRNTAKLNDDGNSVTLSWTFPFEPTSEFDKPRYFVIYKSINSALDTRSSQHILTMIPASAGMMNYTYTDRGVEAGKQYNYAISAVDRLHNESTPTNTMTPSVLTSLNNDKANTDANTVSVNNPTPEERLLVFHAYPNPFNKLVNLRYRLDKADFVKLNVFDERGVRVGSLVNERKSSGKHEVSFNGEFLSSGLYFARLEIGSVSQTLKLVIH